MSHAGGLRQEVRENIPAISAMILIDRAIDSANPDQIDRNTIPDEHAVPIAKYISGLATDRANTYLQLVRRSQAARGISIPRSPQEDGCPIPDAGEIERLDTDAAKTLVLKMLKRVVDYDGRNEDMEDQLEAQAGDGEGGNAPELRSLIYKDILTDVQVYHIKARAKPAFEQWLVPIHESGIACLNRKIATELSTQILHEALTSPQAKIVAKIKNFEFRPLQAFIESLNTAQKEKINSSTSKSVVLLQFTNSRALNEKKLESWLKFRRESNVALTYHVTEGDRSTLLPYMREIYAASSGDGDLRRIYEAVVVWNADPGVVERRIGRWYGDSTRSGGIGARGSGLERLLGGGQDEMVEGIVSEVGDEVEDNQDSGMMESGGEDDEGSLDSDMMSD